MGLNSIKAKVDRLEKAINRDRDILVLVGFIGNEIVFQDLRTCEPVPKEDAQGIIERNESEVLVLDFTGLCKDKYDVLNLCERES